jgi:hypothetical protein
VNIIFLLKITSKVKKVWNHKSGGDVKAFPWLVVKTLEGRKPKRVSAYKIS